MDVWLLIVGVVVIYLLYNYLYVKPKLDKRVFDHGAIIITGCDRSNGFGQNLIKTLHRSNYFDQLLIFAGCFTEAAIDDLKANDNPLLHPFRIDITNDESVNAAVDHIADILLRTNRTLHALLNNAGIACASIPDDWRSVDDYVDILKVNCVAQIRMTMACKHLLKQSSLQNGTARLIFTSSELSMLYLQGMTPYALSKRALEAYADAIRLELTRFNVNVCILRPGGFDTDLTSIENSMTEANKRYESLDDNLKEQYPSKYLNLLHYYCNALKTFTYFNRKYMIADAMVHAISALHPSTRYYPGLESYFIVRWIIQLPTPILDFICNFETPIKAINWPSKKANKLL